MKIVLVIVYMISLPLFLSLSLSQIDWVGRPSWQAQLSGTKTWTLAPPPECENDCSLFNVTVHTGDISES